MSDSAGHRMKKSHVLDFFCDDEKASALTVLVNGVRFHIFVDYERLESSADKGNASVEEYHKLIEKLRTSEMQDQAQQSQHQPLDPDTGFGDEDDGQESDNTDEDVYCICRGPDRGFMIGCDSCNGWFHGDCVGVTEDQKDSIDEYLCPRCEDSGRRKKASSHDSGVVLENDKETNDPNQTLQDWILSFLAPEIESQAPARQDQKPTTVYDWYNPPTKYYSLECKDGKTMAIELEENPELQEKMANLVPKVALPKYILNLGIPWIDARDLEVLEESATPEPMHPSVVRHGTEVYFLKVVDPSQPGPTKREIKLMKQIEKLQLHGQLRVPRVLGLVKFGDSKTEIMGFLQTNIEAAEPLTHMLESDVPQEKRETWAAESERMVSVLHKHDIVWGDAKADNFMVDKDDRLWIIDFGGSYTEGWIEPELNETEEGDEMGTVKIINALKDPDANTVDLDETTNPRTVQAGVKRNHAQNSMDGIEDREVKKLKAV